VPYPWSRPSSPTEPDAQPSVSQECAEVKGLDDLELGTTAAIGQSQIIRTLLTPAARAWLRSQLQSATDLQIQLSGGDGQLLQGHIPSVAISGRGIVYRGLYLSKIQVTAEKIRFNIGQVLRGKPLNPMDPICVRVNLTLQETDLNASLAGSLLSRTVADLFAQWLAPLLTGKSATSLPELNGTELTRADHNLADLVLHEPRFEIEGRSLLLVAEISTAQWGRLPIGLRAGLQIEAGQKIKLIDPKWLTPAPPSAPWPDLSTFSVDLGDHVRLQSLTLDGRHLCCQGEIWVQPARRAI